MLIFHCSCKAKRQLVVHSNISISNLQENTGKEMLGSKDPTGSGSGGSPQGDTAFHDRKAATKWGSRSSHIDQVLPAHSALL